MKTGTGTLKLVLSLLLCLSAACASAADEVKPFVRGSHQKIVSAHAGKPFIVGLWSITCTHCIEDLVLFDKLSKKYRNLDLVLVATDTPEDQQEIDSTLRRYHLQQKESWVFADSFAERLRYEVDAQWYGELPRTYFYDAQGQVLALSGKLDPAQVEGWVRKNYKVTAAGKTE